jgi:hypothetical protein
MVIPKSEPKGLMGVSLLLGMGIGGGPFRI